MKLEDTLIRYSHHKQMANAYRALMTEQLRACHDLEQHIQHELKLKPLPKKDKDKLISLIETGEVVYTGPDEPF